ncbi:MAG: hypothetical protein Q9P01_09155 [Anaerolineae bacterium]|nr:hypothetical protein [Anaerolineae bacterium]MDQ7034984.1 hypothetical protein [Anaerolineae bacterium]
MSRTGLRDARWLIIVGLLFVVGSILAQEAEPQTTINMLGFQRENNQIEWIITVGNIGAVDARNVVITDNLPYSLQIDNVQINTGTANINNQTVTVVLPLLAPGEVVQFSIFSTRLVDESAVNTVCITADNVVDLICVPAIAIQALPNTGEPPYWRRPMLHLGLLTISVSLLMIGLGLFGWQILTVDDE